MAHLENTENWQQILDQKDTLPLRELAKQFDTTPGAISAALRRTETNRAVVGRDGAAEAKAPRRRIVRPEATEEAPKPAPKKKKGRAPSTPGWWTEAASLLDSMSMVEVGAKVGVAPGKVAAEMRRTGTSRKPVMRPIEVAKKPKKRTKRAPAAPAAPVVEAPVVKAAPPTRKKVAPETTYAWKVVYQGDAGERSGVIVAPSLVAAAEKAARVAGDGVTSIKRIGDVIA